MGRFRTRLVIYVLSLVIFTSLSYLVFFLRISDDVLKAESIEKFRNIVLLSGLALTFFATFGAALISLYLAQGITRPLSKLTKATQEISKNNLFQHIKVHTYSEIKELVYSFNHMTQQFKEFKDRTNKHNRDLERTIRARTKELGYIYKIGREFCYTLDLNEVLETIVKRTAQVLNLKSCVILLVVEEPAGERLKSFRAQGVNLKKIEREFIDKAEAISGWVWAKKEALLIKDVGQDNRFLGRKKEKYYTGSLMSIPLEAKGKILGVINANNKASAEPFTENDLLLLKEIATESAIAIENAMLYKSLKEVYVHTISALVKALEAKDHYARSHSENVTKYALAIAQEKGLLPAEIEVIRQACQLHDLGKIGIHDYILNKLGKLSPEEWDEIRMHSLRGAQILEPISFLKEVAELVRQHHERYDGQGYPSKLSGENIQLGARIMAVADSFDAMVSERPYRKAMDLSKAIAELKAYSGTQFDPEIVQLFLEILKRKPELVEVQR